MPWVSPAGLAPLGISVSPCQTPRLELYCWWGGLCQQDKAFHCRTAESKALEGRQRQQKACRVSQNTADRRKHPPEEEEVTQRQKLRGKNSQGSSTLCLHVSPATQCFCIHFYFSQERVVVQMEYILDISIPFGYCSLSSKTDEERKPDF